MRITGVGLLGLASLLPWSTPGPGQRAYAQPAAASAAVVTDTSRLAWTLEDLVRRDDDGGWRLSTQRIEPREDPFGELSLAQVHQMLERQPELLGAASIGRPNAGRLLNGRQLPPSPSWNIQVPQHAWGTPALVSCLQRAVEAVEARFPGPPLCIGDLSQEQGGWLRGHRSHQSGLDADIGFYYKGEADWYVKANEKNLDVQRTWTLVRALVSDCDAEYLFVDLRIQALLLDHAERLGEDPQWLDSLFSRGRNKPGIIRHTWGHQTHMHVRISDDRAQLVGERVRLAKLWARMGRPSVWN